MLESVMELLFLGTGPAEAIPRAGHADALCLDAMKPHSRSRRLRSAAILRSDESSILIDSGPDIGYQLASHRVQHLEAAIITHAHLDAAGGLQTLSDWASAKGHILPVYTEPPTLKRYGTFPGLEYRFTKSGSTTKLGSMTVRFVRVRHSLQPGFPTFGFRIGKLAYASDVASIPTASLQRLHGIDTLVLDAAFWFAQKYRGHLTPDKSIEYAQWLGVKHLVLTQTGHTYPPHHEAEVALKAYAKTHAPDLKVTLSYDGLRLKIS
jgi:phosphoribosyl 1,2-cyclic phosphate phosphodiesterase